MRISMSLPKKLLNEFDEVLKDRGYHSRSKGIRDALQDYIVRVKWMDEMEGDRFGVLSVIYDNDYANVAEKLTNIQHEFREYINSVMHIYMTEKYGMEVIVLKGDIKYIRNLTEGIKRLKGVEHAKLTTTDIEK